LATDPIAQVPLHAPPAAPPAPAAEAPPLPLRRRAWIAAAFSLPGLVAALSGWLPDELRADAAITLATPVCLWAAWPLNAAAARAIAARRLDRYAALAASPAVVYLYGVALALFPAVIPGDVKVPFVAAALGVTGALFLVSARTSRSARSPARSPGTSPPPPAASRRSR
jgi:cation transport ATPase